MKKWILSSYLLWCCIALHAQPKLYAFVISDDSDTRIGAAVDYPKIQSFVATVAQTVGLELVPFYRKKSEISAEILRKTLDNMVCTNDDVVWFYYTGHGYNEYEQGSGQFSAFELSEHGEKVGVSLEWVHTQIQRKKPRLSFTIFDCCNYLDFESKSKVRLSDSKTEAWIRLFGQAEGYVKASSNRAGYQTFSWGNMLDGGIFTNAFLRAFYDVLLGNRQQCTWKNVMEKTTQYTIEKATILNLKQTPQIEIDIRHF